MVQRAQSWRPERVRCAGCGAQLLGSESPLGWERAGTGEPLFACPSCLGLDALFLEILAGKVFTQIDLERTVLARPDDAQDTLTRWLFGAVVRRQLERIDDGPDGPVYVVAPYLAFDPQHPVAL